MTTTIILGVPNSQLYRSICVARDGLRSEPRVIVCDTDGECEAIDQATKALAAELGLVLEEETVGDYSLPD